MRRYPAPFIDHQVHHKTNPSGANQDNHQVLEGVVLHLPRGSSQVLGSLGNWDGNLHLLIGALVPDRRQFVT